MLRKGQEGHVRAERDLLATAATSTRWTVRLAYSFQDVDHLYLVMSFMSGGGELLFARLGPPADGLLADLLTLLIEKDVFEESFAKFYIAEMVLAIEETHKVLGAIHRDVSLLVPCEKERWLTLPHADQARQFPFRQERPHRHQRLRSRHRRSSTLHSSRVLLTRLAQFHWAHDGQYYEQQRRELLHKHGIDLEDGNHAPATTRFDQDRVRGSEEAPGSILTWRDKNRRKLAYSVVGTNNYMVSCCCEEAG